MPALNEAAQIETVLRALAPWRLAGHEVIVVDGGSSDDTLALAGPLADQVLTGPRGRARQMNFGAARAEGDALLFLHADTRLPPQAWQLVQAALAPSAPAAAQWGRFDVRISGRSRWLPMVARMMNWRSRLSQLATGDQAIFMRKGAFDAVGGFPDQPLMEDIEICKRLRLLSAPAFIAERALTSGRRWDQRGAWSTIWLMWQLRWRYWRGESAETLARAYQWVTQMPEPVPPLKAHSLPPPGLTREASQAPEQPAPHPMTLPRTGIAVMAKAPVAGLAKTRLIPALGANGAAALARRLLCHAVEQAFAAQLGPVQLWVTPSTLHPVFRHLQSRHRLLLRLQPEGDVGQRMAAVFAQAASAEPRLPWLLMGTDLPALDAAMLRRAAAELSNHDAVFVPALDGGYGLVGLQQPQRELFDNMIWSTAEVMQHTRSRLQAAGLRHAELPAIPDIDEPADLQHLPAAWGLTLAAPQSLAPPGGCDEPDGTPRC